MQTYSELLRDPRWQRRRLEILERDKWACRCCGDTTKSLSVHHASYHGRYPWEAPDYALVALCQPCHDREENHKALADGRLAESLRSCGALNSDLDGLSQMIEEIAAKTPTPGAVPLMIHGSIERQWQFTTAQKT